jgi:hypothetical protein
MTKGVIKLIFIKMQNIIYLVIVINGIIHNYNIFTKKYYYKN